MNDFTWNLGGCRRGGGGGGGGGGYIFFVMVNKINMKQLAHELCESHSVSSGCLVEGS